MNFKKTLLVFCLIMCFLFCISYVAASNDVVSMANNNISANEEINDEINDYELAIEESNADAVIISEKDISDDEISQDINAENDGLNEVAEDVSPTQALSGIASDDILKDGTSQFVHEAFIIYSPLQSGTYAVNKEMDISVKRVKWIATYINGYLQNDYNYVFLEIIKDGVVEKSIKIYIDTPSSQFSNIGTTYRDKFTPNKMGEYTVRVGFATPDMRKNYGYEHTNGITDINYVGNFTFNVVEKIDIPTGQANANGNTQTKAKQKVKMTAPAMTFKIKTKVKKYVVTLKTDKNKVMSNIKLTLKVNGKTYAAKTNSKGKATFKITKLKKKGTFKAKITFNGNKNYDKLTKTTVIKVK